MTAALDPVELILPAPTRPLVGDFTVRRALPTVARRRIGPFVFLDHGGPRQLAPGQALDVPPHPHIGLATVTYLFAGEAIHRDSLGSEQAIRPGDLNWMTAGAGVVHSERTPASQRALGSQVHVLQLWVGLPLDQEETPPTFQHVDAADLPEVAVDGQRIRVLVGSAYGVHSPVRVLSETLYAQADLAAGSTLPGPRGVAELGAYVVEGVVACGAHTARAGTLLVFRPEVTAQLSTPTGARVVLIGGAPLDGPRHLDWNFVSSRPERIAEAKAAWRERRFPPIPGDDLEFMPLPERGTR